MGALLRGTVISWRETGKGLVVVHSENGVPTNDCLFFYEDEECTPVVDGDVVVLQSRAVGEPATRPSIGDPIVFRRHYTHMRLPRARPWALASSYDDAETFIKSAIDCRIVIVKTHRGDAELPVWRGRFSPSVGVSGSIVTIDGYFPYLPEYIRSRCRVERLVTDSLTNHLQGAQRQEEWCVWEDGPGLLEKAWSSPLGRTLSHRQL